MIGTATPGAETRPGQEHTIGRSPLSRYARWQLRDFLTTRAVVLVIIAALMCYPLLSPTLFRPRSAPPEMMREATRQLREFWIYFMFGALVPLGTLLGIRGIVSEDRQHGYHRFLFAKPVSLVRYYAQSFAVQYVGLMAVLGAVAALYALLVAPVSVVALFVPATVFYVLFGGLSFLFSTVTRTEWVWTLGTVAVSAMVRIFVDEWLMYWLVPLQAILPPLTAIGDMVLKLVKGDVTGGLLVGIWPATYGVIAFVAGLWILRKRSLTR